MEVCAAGRAESGCVDLSEMSSEIGNTQAKEEYPRLSNLDRLALFGGDEHLLNYYLGLRAALAESRQQGDQYFCDPRDSEMRMRIEQEGWKPRVTLKDLKDGGSADLEFSSKQTALEGSASKSVNDSDSDGDASEQQNCKDVEEDTNSFVCGVQGCNARFTSLASHESHYHTSHSFVCHVCRRTLVSSFLLDVHLEENHDSYFQVLSPRVDMYRCLVESCSLKFRTADLRKDHLVTVHKFPSRFSFHGPINSTKITGVRPVKTKSGKNRNVSNNNNTSDMEIADPTLTSSSLLPSQSPMMDDSSQASPAAMEMDLKEPGSPKKGSASEKSNGQQRNRGRGLGMHRGRGRGGGRVPKNICFGRGSQRAFQHRKGSRGRYWHQTQGMDVDTTVDIEKVDFTDMVESLEGGD